MRVPLGGHKTLRRQTVPNLHLCGHETASSLVRTIKHSRALGRISLREAATNKPTSDGALMLRAARRAWTTRLARIG